jgi:hypothetical protein
MPRDNAQLPPIDIWSTLAQLAHTRSNVADVPMAQHPRACRALGQVVHHLPMTQRALDDTNRGEPQHVTSNRPNDLVSMEVVKVSETPPPPPLSSTQCSDTIGSINKVLVIMCNFSRYVVALPIEHENEETIANSLLEKWIIALATRSRLLSDRGASFLSTLNMRLYHNAATLQQDQHVGLHAKL